MTLLQTSAESEARLFTRVGLVMLTCIVIAAVIFVVAPVGRKPHDMLSVNIVVPYVGQGVNTGTPVIMHGVKVGQINSVSSLAGGGVRLRTDLQSGPTRRLTDAIGIDYRPANYFGVTGVNLIPAHTGRPLADGMNISVVPAGNFSLQALLYRFGEISTGVLNKQLIDVIDRVTRYADGLNPLLETSLVVANSLTKVQTVSAERLLRNATGVSVAFPGFTDSIISFGDNLEKTYFGHFDIEHFKKQYKYWPVLSDMSRKQIEDHARQWQQSLLNDDYYNKAYSVLFDKARTDFLSVVAKLESSHINDLMPAVESVRAITDTVPKIVSPNDFAYTITEIRSRLERLYAGSGDERALKVRIVLDRLPGVAAPLGMAGGGSQ